MWEREVSPILTLVNPIWLEHTSTRTAWAQLYSQHYLDLSATFSLISYWGITNKKVCKRFSRDCFFPLRCPLKWLSPTTIERPFWKEEREGGYQLKGWEQVSQQNVSTPILDKSRSGKLPPIFNKKSKGYDFKDKIWVQMNYFICPAHKFTKVSALPCQPPWALGTN